MNHLPVGRSLAGIAACVLLAAFFSGTETALMSLNRYRLRHRVKNGETAARLTERLLARPDRLIALILLGNTLVNVTAGSIVTLVTLETWGEDWLAVANGVLTVVLLLFAEVGPKTFGALHPEALALPSAFVYRPLLFITYPLIWLINWFANGMLKLIGAPAMARTHHSLSADELRIVVAEAGALIPLRHQEMLVSILDLERITVDDIMVPRNEIAGIDLNDDWDEIETALRPGCARPSTRACRSTRATSITSSACCT